ncbi:MAG: hypothetical protein ACTSVA_01180 [Candidatus Njordarchaeales archaeon]
MEEKELDFKKKLNELVAKVASSGDASSVDSLLEFIEKAVKDIVVQGIKESNYAYIVQRLRELEESISSILLDPATVYDANTFMAWVLENQGCWIQAPAERVSCAIAVNYLTGILRALNMVRSAFRSLYLENKQVGEIEGKE